MTVSPMAQAGLSRSEPTRPAPASTSSRPPRATRPARSGCGSPATWTALQQDGPNHLGLRCNELPEHQMALIASGCVRQAGNFDPITSLGATDWVNYAVTAPFSRRFCRGLSALKGFGPCFWSDELTAAAGLSTGTAAAVSRGCLHRTRAPVCPHRSPPTCC